MPLEPSDATLLDRVLQREPDAWPEFVNRTLPVISHVVTHAADCRGVRLTSADREDLIADVYVALLQRDMHSLWRFRRQSSLLTYIAVIARRVIVRSLMQRSGVDALDASIRLADLPNDDDPPVEQRVEDRDQVDAMLGGLAEAEAQVVRLFHLEGHSYHEISAQTGMPENTIGPVLSRARQKLRQSSELHSPGG